MNRDKIHLVIVEDELLVSGMLRTWLRRFPDLELAGCASDGEAGLALCRSAKPQLALIDIRLPKLDGLDLARHLIMEFPAMRVVIMSGLMDAHTIWRVGQSGVHGYVNKTETVELLIEAIRSVDRGNTFFDPNFTQVRTGWLARPESFQKILSEREQEVLRMVTSGFDDEQIANTIGISSATVEVHRKNLRQKLGVHNDRGLVAYARRWGLDAKTRHCASG